MPSDKSIETITLEEALELFKLPRTLGEFEGSPVIIGAGRFGPYVMHAKKYVSLPKNENPLTVTLATAIQLIESKRQQETQRHIKAFEEEPKLEVMNGRYGLIWPTTARTTACRRTFMTRPQSCRSRNVWKS